MGRRRLKIAGGCGVIGPFTVSVFVLLAIYASPWFSWIDNALSDLGVGGYPAGLFNTGLVVGGVLIVVFATGIGGVLGRRLGRVGMLLVLLDGVALGAIGVFPETAGRVHLYVSIAFFTLLSSYLLFFGAAFIIRASEIRWGVFSLLLGVASASVWIFGWRGAAIPEVLAYLSASTWSVTMGFRMLRAETPVKTG